MGCHTWFYAEYKNYTPKQIRKIGIKQCNKLIHQIKQEIDKLNFINHLEDEFEEWDKECKINFLNKVIKYKEYLLNNKNPIRKNFYDILKYFIDEHVTLHSGIDSSIFDYYSVHYEDLKVYRSLNSFEDKYHDTFRVDNYPDETFTDLKSLNKWLNKNHIWLSRKQKIKLKDFWRKYPKGLIKFD